MLKNSFHIITFGCQMNVRDSQWLAARFAALGFMEAPLENAQVIILNTCSVREKPERKVKAAINRIASQTGHNREVLVGVLGCVAQQLGAELFKTSNQTRLVAGADGLRYAPEAIIRLLQNPEEKLSFLDFSRTYEEKAPDRQKGAGSAFVNIMQGCDNYCSYCIVPFTRGRQKSRRKADILAECQGRIAEGFCEIVLLGQNVNAWGKDNGEIGFGALLEKVAALPGLRRLRFITPHPADMDRATIAAFGSLPQLCPRLHLPLQSGSNRILDAMRRRYSREDYLFLVERLKSARPDLTLTTDIITGFPGESEEDFQQTLDMARQCAFASSFSFCYSDRPGARAALMSDKIADKAKLERLARLQALQEELTSAWLQSRIGETVELLVEQPSTKGEFSWQGRDPHGEIVNFQWQTNENPAGRFVLAKITTAKKHTLCGELL